MGGLVFFRENARAGPVVSIDWSHGIELCQADGGRDIF